MGDPISLRTQREEHSPAAAPQMGSQAGLLLVGPAQLPNWPPLLAPGSHTLGVGTLPPTRWPQKRLGSRGRLGKVTASRLQKL